VYTDLKAENLVFMEEQPSGLSRDASGAVAIVSIKGVDLESCIPFRGNPVDYTPEACPPEFAAMHLSGTAYDFVVEYSYDVWSFGMLAYELATGRPFFKGKTPEQIMAVLADPEFVPPMGGGDESGEGYYGAFDANNNNAVIHEELKELIRRCLQIDPRRRPSVRKLLGFPYFQQDFLTEAYPSESSESDYGYDVSMETNNGTGYGNNNNNNNGGGGGIGGVLGGGMLGGGGGGGTFW